MRLLVLGVVRAHQPTYGYAVRRELVAWQADTWTDIRPGSIYHALKQLAREEKLRTVGIEGSTQGPGRTLFEITPGEAEFLALLHKALTSIDMEELGAGIAFMDTLPRASVIELLQQQRRASAEVRDGLLEMIPDYPQRHRTPHSPDLLELWSGAFSNLTDWTGRLIARLQGGEYTMADDQQDISPATEANDPVCNG